MRRTISSREIAALCGDINDERVAHRRPSYEVNGGTVRRDGTKGATSRITDGGAANGATVGCRVMLCCAVGNVGNVATEADGYTWGCSGLTGAVAICWSKAEANRL